MVEILLSEKHKNFFHIKYSKITNSKEDDAHFHLLKSFARQHDSFLMIIEMEIGTTVTDRKWFEVSQLVSNPTFKSLEKAICFGYEGIHMTFLRKYFEVLKNSGLKVEMFKNLFDYEKKYQLSVAKDFRVNHVYEVHE